MSDIEKDVCAFIETIDKGPFKCLKESHDEGDSDYVVKNNNSQGNIYYYAIEQAWLDMCRTCKNAGQKEKEMRSQLAGEIENYFKRADYNDYKGFDIWYYRRLATLQSEGLTVGQAQKLINMTFKYLYCCSDIRDNNEDYFRFCHMPLDNYTIEWYTKKSECSHPELKTWSKLDCIESYQKVTNDIRSIIVSEEFLGNVLEKEFHVWNIESRISRTKGLIKSLKSFLKVSQEDKRVKNELLILIVKLSKKLKEIEKENTLA